ncbi:MAG TPA: hypothetical protein VM123_12250 [archaeon]|nr:hypothetical protein [archaeon]
MGTVLANRILDNANNWLHRMATKKRLPPVSQTVRQRPTQQSPHPRPEEQRYILRIEHPQAMEVHHVGPTVPTVFDSAASVPQSRGAWLAPGPPDGRRVPRRPPPARICPRLLAGSLTR